MTNGKTSLTTEFSGPFGAIPYGSFTTEDFMPALDESLAQARENIAAICKKPASFKETIVGLETASENVDLVTGIFFNLMHAHSDEKMHALATEISPKVAQFSNDIFLDEELFKKVKEVYNSSSDYNLNGEETELLNKFYKAFVRNGALLSDGDKTKLRALADEMSKLGPQYNQNLLKATHAFELLIEDEAQLEGLPERVREAARTAAKEKKKPDGTWLFTLDAPSFVPFLTYSTQRNLREKMHKAYTTRAYQGEFDNVPCLKRIAELRYESAKLLGFATHAEYVLQERMAEKPAKVEKFLGDLLKVAKPAAEHELEELREFAQSIGGPGELRPWDLAFYSEKLKKKKFDLDEEELRPYFPLEKVVEGVFLHAEKLFGLIFKERSDIPRYHPEVKTYEVSDKESSRLVGLFYTDFFPRSTKKNGAWMTPLREQGLFGGEVRRPHVSICCNFTKPGENTPSLLSMDEVRTLFHEFGHALHGLLSQCNFRSLAGTNVYWDFVELPSQMMENWTQEKEALDLFAAHYKTGEKIPMEMTEKLKKLSSYQEGMGTLRQLSFAMLDMAWHNADPSKVGEIESFEERAMAATRLMDRVPGTAASPAFAHIFAGGYAAGYYSYKWAEVLDADAFELFKEKGLFNQEVATAFKENILSRGGTEKPMSLYVKFRGREPDPEALLRRAGLVTGKAPSDGARA